MRFDVQNQLSVAQAFPGVATVSTNSYAKQSAAQDISIGRRYALWVLPTVAAGAGSTGLFEAIQADDAALTVNVEVLNSVTADGDTELQLGDEVEVPFPQGTMTRQYLGLRNTMTGGVTTLTADCYLVPQDEIAKYKSFPKINIA